jgi:hypothetical protein
MPTPSSRRQAWQDAMFALQCLAVLLRNNPRCQFKRPARLATTKLPFDAGFAMADDDPTRYSE